MNSLEIYKRVFGEVRCFLPQLGLLTASSLLATPIALLGPVPLKIAVDSAIDGRPPPALVAWLLPQHSTGAVLALASILLVGIVLLGLIQKLGSWVLREYLGQKIVLHFRARLFRHVQRLSTAFHEARGTAHATYVIQYDAPAVQWITIDGVIPYAAAAVTLISLLVTTALLSWPIALLAMAVSPIVVWLTWVYSHRLRHQWRQVKRVESAALGVVQEVLGTVRVVKAFAQENREQARFVRQSSRSADERVRVTISESWFSLLVGLTTGVGSAAGLYLGVRLVLAGTLTTGELLLILGYLAMLYEPLKTIGKQVASQQGSLASAERAFGLLDERPEVVERPNARRIRRAYGHLELRDVSFAYERGRPILERVSLDVPAGTRVGISGCTGAGKTTLVSLLTRFFDPTDGEILLDGVDLRDYRLEDLRRQFSIVLQDTVLFSTTIAENIAYARPEASMDEIVAAADAANASPFIEGLTEGFQTQVGERGMRLSGGERQRIALARAFLADAPVLMLDEPTSAVDVKTEAAIIGAMERLMQGRTTFMIAHRLSTLRGCDLHLTIDKGRVGRIAADGPVRSTA